jgi:hypothetical protein
MLADHKVEMIEATLAEAHRSISGSSDVAAQLGIPRQTLDCEIRRLGIDKSGQKRSASKSVGRSFVKPFTQSSRSAAFFS